MPIIHVCQHVNATLSKHAFLTLVTACIEVYKQETIGALLGERHRKHYKILDALGYQTAKRGYWQVHVPAQRLKRLDYVLKHITKSKVLGFFHSHPDFPDRLSGMDKKEHIQERLPIQILVLVKKTTKKKNWTFHDDFSLSGTIGSKYFVKLRAYELDPAAKTICPMKIVCPFLRGITMLESV